MTLSTSSYTQDDLIGQHYGKLTVIAPATRPSHRRMKGSYYLCLCECGNTTITSRKQLISGRVRSCGCLQKRSSHTPCKSTRQLSSEGTVRNRKTDMVGRKFGILTVLAPAPTKDHILSYWTCRCACGNEILVSSDALRKGKVDCGCLSLDERVALKKSQKAARKAATIRKYQEMGKNA